MSIKRKKKSKKFKNLHLNSHTFSHMKKFYCKQRILLSLQNVKAFSSAKEKGINQARP